MAFNVIHFVRERLKILRSGMNACLQPTMCTAAAFCIVFDYVRY